MADKNYREALTYHEQGRPGKIEVVPTKPTQTKRDLSLAYSPGVAGPCLEIAKNVENIYKYTAKGNLVAVISNGSAVLGLGNIGPEASKPVMEGKGLLFKIFADIDVFDIELNSTDVDHFVQTVKALEPTFGGINLEDIAAPESFEIEEKLKAAVNIPLMHDDQHGTAIISSAGLINALRLVGKRIDRIKMVINGAGASAIACGKLFISLGVQKKHILMLDSNGVITTKRDNLSDYKSFFARNTKLNTLDEAMKGADVFIGLSRANIVTQKMIRSMAKKPIVFAMANPDPEIDYELALASRPDVVVATGRSDHPNQVNNVLGFPFIFRGALDVRAKAINEEMKLAAVHAIAQLTLEPVPEVVNLAYGETNLVFGKDYLIPKPIDPRLITSVAPAVAKAAMDSGVARIKITDWKEYERQLRARMGLDNKFMSRLSERARRSPKKVVFAEADSFKMLRAAQLARDEGYATPILLGQRKKIKSIIKDNSLDLQDVEIIDPMEMDAKRDEFGAIFHEKRKRKGITLYDACKAMRRRTYFGTMMVETGMADAFISGLTKNYPNAIRPALQIIGRKTGFTKVAGMYIIMSKKGPLFFADTTVNINPSADDLVQIVRLAHEHVSKLQVEPRIAMLSYSNFGSVEGEIPKKIQAAIRYLHQHHPEIQVDGEMQANFALNREMRAENFPFSKLGDQSANTLIFPDLTSGNIGYKMIQTVGAMEAIGPVLMGFRKSIHVLQLGSSVREILNMIQVAVVDAQSKMELL